MTNDNDELRDRVEQLEQTVQQQQDTIRKMLPNRRQALKGVGLLAGGGLLGAAGGSASASTGSAGQIGTTSDRPDAYTDTLDSNVVSTAKINNPNESRNAIRFVVQTVPAGAKSELLPSLMTTHKLGYLIVRYSSYTATFTIAGGRNVVSEVADPDSSFSTSEGTSNSFNLYWDGTNGQYELENGFGSDRELKMTLIS